MSMKMLFETKCLRAIHFRMVVMTTNKNMFYYAQLKRCLYLL